MYFYWMNYCVAIRQPSIIQLVICNFIKLFSSPFQIAEHAEIY